MRKIVGERRRGRTVIGRSQAAVARNATRKDSLTGGRPVGRQPACRHDDLDILQGEAARDAIRIVDGGGPVAPRAPPGR